jgi:hypothetical protein
MTFYLQAITYKKGTKLLKGSGTLLSDAAPYRTLIGKLIYLTNTRPEFSYRSAS